MIYSSRVLALILALCIFSCARNSKNEIVQQTSRVLLSTTDTCRFCDLNPFLIESSSHHGQVNTIFDYPVALVYLNRKDTVVKYWIRMPKLPGSRDTLMKRLKLSNFGQVHSILEQGSYYSEIVEPELIKEHVVIVDTVSRSQIVSFKTENKSYLINLKTFKNTDGIIMFKPGKRPIFWTMDKVGNHCSGYDGIVKWYYGCLEQ